MRGRRRLAHVGVVDREVVVLDVDQGRASVGQAAKHHGLREWLLELLLDQTSHRPRPHLRVVPVVGEPFPGGIAELDVHLLFGEHLAQQVDLFVDHPVPFEELWSRSNEFELRDTTVRVASIPDLIHMTRLAGRSQDQADIEKLEFILKAKKKREDD